MQYLPTHPGAARAQALLNEAQQARQARLAQAAARAQADRQPARAARAARLTFLLAALRRHLHLA